MSSNRRWGLVPWLMAALLLSAVAAGSQAQQTVRMISRGDHNADYTEAMVRLALDKAGYDYRLKIRPGELTMARLVRETSQGRIDIMWSATTRWLENTLIPVRVPLYKGLIGHRIMMVHPDNREMFAQVETLNQLRQFDYGQGSGWPDTRILRDNGFQVREESYDRLPVMVHGKRFDAFPRAIYEIWAEVERRPELDLAADRHLMLIYPMPFYLFVNPDRPELAQALERGLMVAVEDGSFDRQFHQTPMMRRVREEAGVEQRRIFRLDNDSLPEATPLDDERLWLSIGELIGGDEGASVDQAGRSAE